MLETFGLQQGGTRTQTAAAAKELRLDEAFLDALADSSPVTAAIGPCPDWPSQQRPDQGL
jgi:hypothetical protein